MTYAMTLESLLLYAVQLKKVVLAENKGTRCSDFASSDIPLRCTGSHTVHPTVHTVISKSIPFFNLGFRSRVR